MSIKSVSGRGNSRSCGGRQLGEFEDLKESILVGVQSWG